MVEQKTMETFIKQYAKYLSRLNPLESEDVIDLSEVEPEEYFNKATESWINSFDEVLDSTPKEYLESVEKPKNEEETYEIIRMISLNLTVMAPKLLVDYLCDIEYTLPILKKILNGDVITKAYETLFNEQKEYEDFEIYRQAVVVSSRYPELAKELLESFIKCHDANDNILEHITESLRELKAYDEVIEFLNGEKEIDDKHLHLLVMLAETESKEDKIYNCLKRCFKRIKEDSIKLTAVYIFVDYGDSRIVPLLRKYAKELVAKKQNSTNEDEGQEIKLILYTVLSVIESFGGNIEDIKIF